MSEHITHTAICDDVRRVCLRLGDLPPEFLAAWQEHLDVSRLGGVTRHADKWSADLIAYARDELAKPPAERDPDTKRKLAFVLGALTHRSIDRHMKPVFAYFKQSIDARIENGAAINECTIYCDMLILREVFAIDSHFSPNLFDKPAAERRAALHDLLRTIWQRVLIQMHTFKPDDSHIHEWLQSLFRGVQDFELRLDLYDDVAANPDPQKWNRYLVETNFYNAKDPIIATARAIQRGEAMSAEAISAVVEQGTQDQSLYGRAMHRAIEYIRAGGELFRGRLTIEQTCHRLDIGVKELAMTFQPPTTAPAPTAG